MDKSAAFTLSVTFLLIAFMTLYTHSLTSQCYEVVPPSKKLQTMLLDKCSGTTYMIVEVENDTDNDGKVDSSIPTWTPMEKTEYDILLFSK